MSRARKEKSLSCRLAKSRIYHLPPLIDCTKIVLVNIYAPNDATHQVVFLRDISKEFLIPYANNNLVLGGDFNRTISTLDQKRGRPIDNK